jgi:hypothetical protein
MTSCPIVHLSDQPAGKAADNRVKQSNLSTYHTVTPAARNVVSTFVTECRGAAPTCKMLVGVENVIQKGNEPSEMKRKA